MEESKQHSRLSEELPKVIMDIEDSNVQLSLLLDSLKHQAVQENLNTNAGISLLDVKNQMMLSYLINVVYVIAKKCHGESIEEDSAVGRLVEIRTVLERIRPLEQKLKYMMEKMVKTALTGVGDENNPTCFRANPDNMIHNISGSGSDSEEDETLPSGKQLERKSGLYVPPRLAPMHYDEEESQATRRQKQLKLAKKRALHSSVIEELREEYLDTPVEVSHGNILKDTLSRRQRQKNQYEEEYFTRLPTSKKDQHRDRHSLTEGNIGNQLTHFEDIQVLEDEKAFKDQSKHKRKFTGGHIKKKGFKRRKAHLK